MMKNDDHLNPYEPSLAEIARLQTQLEKTIFSDFNEVDNEKDLVGKPNGLVARLFFLVVVVLIITFLLLMVTKTTPAALATISWNG
jgi:hypothetical protein